MQVTLQRQKPSWTMLAAFNFGTNTGKAVSGLYPGLMVNKAQDKKKNQQCANTYFCFHLLYYIHHFMTSR